MTGNRTNSDVTLEQRLFEVHKKAGIPIRVMTGKPNLPNIGSWSVAYPLAGRVTELIVPEGVDTAFYDSKSVVKGVTNVSAEYAPKLSEITGVPSENLVTNQRGSKTGYIRRDAVDIRALIVPERGDIPFLIYTFVWPIGADIGKDEKGGFKSLQTAEERMQQYYDQGLIMDSLHGFQVPNSLKESRVIYDLLEDMIPVIVVSDTFNSNELLRPQVYKDGKLYAERLSLAAKVMGVEIPAEAFLTNKRGQVGDQIQSHTVSLHSIPVIKRNLTFFTLTPSRDIIGNYIIKNKEKNKALFNRLHIFPRYFK